MRPVQNSFALVSLALAVMTATPLAQAGFNDLLEKGSRLLQSAPEPSGTQSSSNLDTATLAAGLKEALSVGTERAIDRLSTAGGFANHADVRIPLPGGLDKVGGLMRQYGLGSQVDAFEASMNAAAETAVRESTPILANALETMTLEDARKIYSGGDTAATDYFKQQTQSPLAKKFRPVIEQAMSQAGVMQAYNALVGQAEKNLPMISGVAPDIGEHVTRSTLDGLFLRLAEEEKRIRQQPIARSTELLKQVFGN